MKRWSLYILSGCLWLGMVSFYLKKEGEVKVDSEQNAPTQQTDCLEQIKQAYTHLSELSKKSIENERTEFVDYTVVSIHKDSSSVDPVESNFKMWTKGDLTKIISNHIEVYSDQKDAFTVIPSQKLIIRTLVSPVTNKNDRHQAMGLIQQTVFDHCRVTRCKVNDQRKQTHTTITLDKEGREKFGISTIDFTLKKGDGSIEKMAVNYTEFGNPRGLAKVAFTVNAIEMDHKGTRLSHSVSRLFLNGSGTLNKKYTGYQFVDNRTNQ